MLYIFGNRHALAMNRVLLGNVMMVSRTSRNGTALIQCFAQNNLGQDIDSADSNKTKILDSFVERILIS